jgi:hypothetical protein
MPHADHLARHTKRSPPVHPASTPRPANVWRRPSRRD